MNETPSHSAVDTLASDLPVRVVPVTSPYASDWYAADVDVTEPRAPLAVDIDTDVCVIGGGLAGLTAAREIARRGWSVVLLEAEIVGGAASGRNTGLVLPGFGEDLTQIVERVGVDHARQLWALSEQGVGYVRHTVAELNLQSETGAPGWLTVSRHEHDAELAARAERFKNFNSKAEFWPRDKVRGVLPTDRYFSAIHFPDAFAINPLRYTLALARDAEKAGVRIFEHTPAVSIDPAGIRKRITTPAARVRASQIVMAGSVSLGPLVPRLSATLVPVTSYVMVTEPLGPILREAIRYRGAISDDAYGDRHYRIVGDDRLLVAGRATAQTRDPKRLARALARDIKRLFPQLGDVVPAHAWSGTLGQPIHRMPQIGEVSRGVWVASGFSGHGLNTTAMAGELIARGMTEGDQTWRLFAPYELVWAGGAFGRAIMSTILTGRRPVESVRGALARYRERIASRRAAAKAKRAEATARLKAEQEAAQRVAAYQAAANQIAAAQTSAQSGVPAAASASVTPASDIVPAREPVAAPVTTAAAQTTAVAPEKPRKNSGKPRSGKSRAKKPRKPRSGN